MLGFDRYGFTVSKFLLVDIGEATNSVISVAATCLLSITSEAKLLRDSMTPRSSLFTTAAVVTFCTDKPKLPLNPRVQPGGGAALGDTAAVTACGMATGLASLTVTKERKRTRYCILEYVNR